MDRVYVFCVDVEGLVWPDNNVKRFVSQSRAARLERLRASGKVGQSLAAELALARALEAFGLPNEPPGYYYGENGKPRLTCGKCEISLAHTEGLAVCAIAEFPVGVDAERLREVPKAAARRFLTASEQEKLPESADMYLLEKWVAKESYAKLTGDGAAKSSFTSLEARDGMLMRSGVTEARYVLMHRGEHIICAVASNPFNLVVADGQEGPRL